MAMTLAASLPIPMAALPMPIASAVETMADSAAVMEVTVVLAAIILVESKLNSLLIHVIADKSTLAANRLDTSLAIVQSPSK